jgi:pyruvate dehydrogenase E1 component alpha subunit
VAVACSTTRTLPRPGAEAEEFAARVRSAVNADVEADPFELSEHVFAEPTPQFRDQRALLASELNAQEG